MARRGDWQGRLRSVPAGVIRRFAPSGSPWPDVRGVAAPDGPPSGGALAAELRAVAQVARLVAAAPWLVRVPRGDGSLVLDLPGWRAPEASNVLMRSWLRSRGWDARPWGLGTNQGRPERDAEMLAERIAALPAGTPPVALIGWSLGGTVAREVARVVPDRVRTVVTYGSPVIGGPTHTIGARAFGRDECRRIETLARELDRDNPIAVPRTAIFTRRDAIVNWRACIDHSPRAVRHVEVRSTHLGLGLDPDVWWTVAHALADPTAATPDAWSPS